MINVNKDLSDAFGASNLRHANPDISSDESHDVWQDCTWGGKGRGGINDFTATEMEQSVALVLIEHV